MEPLNVNTVENEILQRLDCRLIPILPPGMADLLTSLTDDSIDFVDLASLLERYPSLAGRLIAIANSAWSSPVTEISSLEATCTRLGLNVIRSICIALAVASPFNPSRCPGFSARQHWSSALLAADAAAWLTQCSHTITIEPATARAAGLMHNLGLLLLADKLPNEVNAAISMSETNQDISLSTALETELGFNHSDAGRILANSWKLPDVLCNAMSYKAVIEMQETTDISELICLTTSMIATLQRNHPWSIPAFQLEKLMITSTDATKIYERLSRQLEKTREMADSLF